MPKSQNQKSKKPTRASKKLRLNKAQTLLGKLNSRWAMLVVVLSFGVLGLAYLQLTSAQATKEKIKVIAHNQTEGNMLDVYWTADVLLFSETDHAKIRKQAPKHYEWYFPQNDSHQAIGWNTKTMRLDSTSTPTRSHRFHQSGQAEGWSNIATPARYIHEVDLVNKKTGVSLTVYETWWLNSWRTEDRRREIVERTTIPVVKERSARVLERKRVGIGGGDFNNITYDFKGKNTFPGWSTAPQGGLDRMFWTKDPRLAFEKISEGPKTGVGNQMQHHSLITEFMLSSK